MADLRTLITALDDHHVEFVILGAVALRLQGSARITEDLDICYGRGRANLERLAAALQPFAPRLRGVPAGVDLPFALDVPTLSAGLNFTLTTTRGDLDLLGEVTGLGTYDRVERFSERMDVYERQVRVLTLDGLERAKRAAGRLKDIVDLEEILIIRRLRDGRDELS